MVKLSLGDKQESTQRIREGIPGRPKATDEWYLSYVKCEYQNN